MRGAILTKLPSAIEEPSLIAFFVSGGRITKPPDSQNLLTN
jgi:hypothetical protein